MRHRRWIVLVRTGVIATIAVLHPAAQAGDHPTVHRAC